MGTLCNTFSFIMSLAMAVILFEHITTPPAGVLTVFKHENRVLSSCGESSR